VDVSSPDGKRWKFSGSWASIVRVEMPGPAAWPLELARPPDREPEVEGGTRQVLGWTLSPEITSTLPRSDRALEVVLESPGTGDGIWKGTVRSLSLRIHVIDEPRPLPKGWAERKAEVEIEYVYFREGVDRALSQVDAESGRQPQNWRLLGLKAQLLASVDRGSEGLKAFDQAVEVWRRSNPRSTEPPVELLFQRDALQRSILKKKRG
jgi:hypothetical protein